MQFNIAGMFLNVEPRFGIGLDIESVESRPVWTVKDGELSTMAFDGLVLLLPLLYVRLRTLTPPRTRPYGLWTDCLIPPYIRRKIVSLYSLPCVYYCLPCVVCRASRFLFL